MVDEVELHPARVDVPHHVEHADDVVVVQLRDRVQLSEVQLLQGFVALSERADGDRDAAHGGGVAVAVGALVGLVTKMEWLIDIDCKI